MKRTALGALCLFVALPLFAGNGGDRKSLVSTARCVSLDHTRDGWRMEIRCHEGQGAIVRIDTSATTQYRGTGIFAGSSQDELDGLYRSLIPHDDTPQDVPQLG